MPRTRSAPVAESAPHVARLRAREAGTGPSDHGPPNRYRMKKSLLLLLALCATLAGSRTATAQTYVKLNGLYALAGVVNPAVEFAVSPHSTVQAEIVVSPWNSIRGKHTTFGILMGEYRRYFRGHNDGWYLGANIGMMAFDMSKPFLDGMHLRFEDRYCKGLRHDDRPVRRLRVAFPRTVGARRVLRLVVDVELLQRIQHGG